MKTITIKVDYGLDEVITISAVGRIGERLKIATGGCIVEDGMTLIVSKDGIITVKKDDETSEVEK